MVLLLLFAIFGLVLAGFTTVLFKLDAIEDHLKGEALVRRTISADLEELGTAIVNEIGSLQNHIQTETLVGHALAADTLSAVKAAHAEVEQVGSKIHLGTPHFVRR